MHDSDVLTVDCHFDWMWNRRNPSKPSETLPDRSLEPSSASEPAECSRGNTQKEIKPEERNRRINRRIVKKRHLQICMCWPVDLLSTAPTLDSREGNITRNKRCNISVVSE